MTVSRKHIFRALLNMGLGAVGLLLTGSGTRAADVPAPYVVDGKEVALNCLMPLSSPESSRYEPVDLGKCPEEKWVKDENSERAGMIGFGYHTAGYPSLHADFYYRYVGRAAGLDILLIQYWGGGSGQFSLLMGVKRTGNKLQLKQSYAYGDRCNGTVAKVEIKKGKLSYETVVTPGMLLYLADKDHVIASSEGLEDSPISCQAQVHFEGTRWTAVSLMPKKIDPAFASSDAQLCFDKLANDYIDRGKGKLTRGGFTAFEKDYAKRCAS